MPQTLESMALEAGEMVGKTDTHHLSVCRKAIKRRYREISQAHEWPELAREITVTVASGSGTVALPFVTEVIQSVWNATQSEPVDRISIREMESIYGDQMAVAGLQCRYAIQGVFGSNANLLTPFTAPVFVKSNSANDSCVVRLEGYTVSTGLPFFSTGTVNGTSQIFLGFDALTQLNNLSVTAFTKDVDTVGAVTLEQSGVSGALAVIAPGQRYSRYTWLRFNALASAATSMRIQCIVTADDLTDDNDIPIMRGVEAVLVVGAAADLYRYSQMHQKAMLTEQVYQQMKRDYIDRGILLDAQTGAQGTMHRYREAW